MFKGGQIELRSPAVHYAPVLEMHSARVQQMPDEKPQPQRKYFGHNKGPLSETKDVPAVAPAPVVVKKERFSFLKRNSSVAAH